MAVGSDSALEYVKKMSEVKRGRFLEEFHEVNEVAQIIDNITSFFSDQIAIERNVERFQYIINEYQEQPHLLDPHLESLLSQLLDIVKTPNAPPEVISIAFTFLYFITKTRGYKVIVRMMPHEVADLEPLLAMLAKRNPASSENWETTYMLLLWLSIVCMIPFDMCRFDANVAETPTEKIPVMIRIINLGKLYLEMVDKSRDAAAYMLSRFLTRPDVKVAALSEFIGWSLTKLKQADIQTSVGRTTASGMLTVLALLYKFGKREDLLEYAPTILEQLNALNFQESNNTLLRKLVMKATQRLGLTFLKARVAAWRYQRGSRSLVENLKSSNPAKLDMSQDGIQDHEADDYEIPDQIEEVIEKLLSGLKDNDTVVRWSAAKGIGRITGRLPLELADEVVGSVMELFTFSETVAAWHGGCLCLAELGRRGLLLPDRLKDVVPIIIRALNYDEKRANFSVGANVRDAACYICWAFARAYDTKELAPYVNQIAEALVIVSIYDREVNVRRAAAAAFQENVGRLGSFPHGIDILTMCDYFAVGNRTNCYLELSNFVAQFDEYTLSLIEHLVDIKICHWDISLRELAAEGLHHLTLRVPEHMTKNVLPKVIEKCLASDANTHHGALIALGQIIYALSKSAASNGRSLGDVLDLEIMKRLLELTTEIQEAKFFKGVNGDMMRKAVCCLIEKFSMSHVPFHETAVIGVWQSLINECLENIDADIQMAAVSALPAFCTEYYKCEVHSNDLVSKYVRELENPVEKSRCGYALALGSLPEFLLSGNLMFVLRALVKAATIQPKQEALVEGRRDAVKAVMSICKTVGAKESCSVDDALCAENVGVVYELFFNSLKDYTLDSRGDVGTWVREAAMVGLHEVTSLIVSTCPHLFNENICKRIFCSLVQQASEKIDRTRGVAGSIFSKLLYHIPEIPYIPHREELLRIFPSEDLEDINWTVPSHTFVRFAKLLSLPAYTYSILLGLTVSAGGLTESLVKHAMGCLVSFLSDISNDSEQQKMLTASLLTVFSDHQKVDRVTISFFKMINQLLANTIFVKFIVENNADFPMSLLQLTKAEISKCKDVQKILASIDVFNGLLQFSDDVRMKSLAQLMIFLCHNYPIVRKNASSNLYESIVTYDNVIEDAVLDDVTALLTETQWDQPVDVVRPIRNQLCDLLGVPKPTLHVAAKTQ